MQHWIVPCNLNILIFSHIFHRKRQLYGKTFPIYKKRYCIYIGAPYSKIGFKCTVTDACISETKLLENSYALPSRPISNLYKVKPQYIEMKLLYEYPEDVLKLKDLRECGLVQVQVQARINPKLQTFIESIG